MQSREDFEKIERATREGDVAHVMSSPQGRRFVARVLYEGALLKSVNRAVDPQVLAFHEGQRSVGAAIETLLELSCPALRDVMEVERIGNERTRAQTVPSDSDSSPS